MKKKKPQLSELSVKIQKFHRGGSYGKVLCCAWWQPPDCVFSHGAGQVEALQFPGVLAQLGQWDVAHD